jgi:hypothetical protein
MSRPNFRYDTGHDRPQTRLTRRSILPDPPSRAVPATGSVIALYPLCDDAIHVGPLLCAGCDGMLLPTPNHGSAWL